MITFVYDVLFGYTGLFFFDGACTYLKQGSETVHPCIGFAWIRRLRLRYLEYWHPE